MKFPTKIQACYRQIHNKMQKSLRKLPVNISAGCIQPVSGKMQKLRKKTIQHEYYQMQMIKQGKLQMPLNVISCCTRHKTRIRICSSYIICTMNFLPDIFSGMENGFRPAMPYIKVHKAKMTYHWAKRVKYSKKTEWNIALSCVCFIILKLP